MNFALITLLFSSALFSMDKCEHTKDYFNCVQYVKNYDADTITFNIPNIHPLIGEKISIRVVGVDTPEIKTKNRCEKEKAINARDAVKKLLSNAKEIKLTHIQRGKYFRVVADVIYDGKSLSEYLLKNGHAYHYRGGKKKKMNWCKSLRQIASGN